MTLTLAHPAAEDLGRFVEGTLDDAGRAAVVAHIADCDECRIVVVDAAEFVEPSAARADRSRWLAIAAVVVLVITGAGFFYNQTRDPLAKTREAYGRLSKRPLEARLNHFPYVPRHVTRSADTEDSEPELDIMRGEASEVADLRGHSAKRLNERAIGLLLSDGTDKPITLLEEATKREPDNAGYQSDLAAALIFATLRQKTAAGRQQELERAVQACDLALKIDPNMPEALFNRAIALQTLDQKSEAIKAYKKYLVIDPSSKWAEEARQSLESLQLPP